MTKHIPKMTTTTYMKKTKEQSLTPIWMYHTHVLVQTQSHESENITKTLKSFITKIF